MREGEYRTKWRVNGEAFVQQWCSPHDDYDEQGYNGRGLYLDCNMLMMPMLMMNRDSCYKVKYCHPLLAS